MSRARPSGSVAPLPIPGPPSIVTTQVVIEVPLQVVEETDPAFMQGHIDFRLDGELRRVLKGFVRGLDAGPYRLRNGKRPQTSADAFRWLLEQLAAKSA